MVNFLFLTLSMMLGIDLVSQHKHKLNSMFSSGKHENNPRALLLFMSVWRMS